MHIVLLDAKTLGEDIDLSVLKTFGTLTIYQTTATEETGDRVRDADIIITNKVFIDRRIMDLAPKLKLICIAATGMNNIDHGAAQEKNIAVKNVDGYSTNSVVQHTFALLFQLLEHLRYYENIVTNGQWYEHNIFTNLDRPFFELHGKNWGIIGLGAIGHEVAKVATSFGTNVYYFSTSGIERKEPYERKNLENLLSESEIITIHAPLNEKTYNLLDYDLLSLMKKKSILINVGRGGIVNENDLAKLLDEKEIYAGLDVLEKEPMEPSNPLTKIKHKERLFITPHIAWSSVESRQKLLEGIVKNIQGFIS